MLVGMIGAKIGGLAYKFVEIEEAGFFGSIVAASFWGSPHHCKIQVHGH